LIERHKKSFFSFMPYIGHSFAITSSLYIAIIKRIVCLLSLAFSSYWQKKGGDVNKTQIQTWKIV